MTVSLLENSADVASLLSVQSLEEAVRAVEPAAVLIPPWLMQHVVSFEQGPGRLQLTLHDCEIRSIPRQRFETIARDNAAALPEGMPAVDTLILLVKPEGEWLAARSQGQKTDKGSGFESDGVCIKLLQKPELTRPISTGNGKGIGNGKTVWNRIERIGVSNCCRDPS